VTFDPGLDEPAQMLLFDAQTSGGLLLCLPPDAWEGFRAAAAEAGLETWGIGEVVEGEGVRVTN